MRKKNLLDKIQQEQVNAICPIASWRSPANRILDFAREFITENVTFGVGAKPTFEIDPDSGSLNIYWSVQTSWSELYYVAKTLGSIIAPQGQRYLAKLERSAIRSLEVKLRYDIPMFKNPDPKNHNSFSDDQPVREDFVDNLKTFVIHFDSIQSDVRHEVFEPVSTHLCNVVKQHP